MLVNVHVTPSVVVETSRSVAKFSAPALRRELREFLLRHGVLRFASNAEAKTWIDGLKSEELTPQEAKEWQQLLLTLNKLGRLVSENPALVEDADSATSKEELLPLAALSPLLSVIGTDTYGRLFPDAEVGVSPLKPNLDVTVPGSISQSAMHERLINLAQSGSFLRGTKRNDLWATLLEPLARVSKEIVVFDRYLFGQLEASFDEQVNWLLSRLDASAPKGAAVTLIGARGVPGDFGNERVPGNAADAEWLIRENVSQKFERLGSVRVALAPSVRVRDMHHDRHIRFGAGAAVEVPAGFDRLAVPELRDNFGFTYRHSTDALKQLRARETAVLDNRNTRVVELI